MSSKYENKQLYPGLKDSLQIMSNLNKTFEMMAILLRGNWTKSKVETALGALKIVKSDGTLYPDLNASARRRYWKKFRFLTQDENEGLWSQLDSEFIVGKMDQIMKAQTSTLNEFAKDNAQLKIKVKELNANILKLKALVYRITRDKVEGQGL